MPDWTRYVRERLRIPDMEAARHEDVVDELAAELEERWLAALAEGRAEHEARALVEGEIEDWDALAESILRERGASGAARVDRDVETAEASLRARGGGWVSLADALHAFRLATRRLRRSRGFSIVVLVTLGVAIGANTSIFSVVNGVLLRPLPYDEPDRLVSVWTEAPGLGEDFFPQSPAVHVTYEEESELLENVGMWQPGAVTVLEPDGPARVEAAWTTSGVFRALGVEAAIGRRFTTDEDHAASPPAVMLGHGYWRSRFGGDPEAVGGTLTVDGIEHLIVGIAPEGFRLLDDDPDVYVSLPIDRSQLYSGNFTYLSLARLGPEVTREAAEAELSRLLRVAVERYPGGLTLEQLEQARGRAHLTPLRDDVVGDVGDVLWLLLGGVGIILVVACANVANLFLVRAESRERELAVRSALGAGRRDITGEFLVESLLLALGGGVLGTWLAYGGLRLLVAIAPPDVPRLAEISIDPAVLLFALAISLASGLAFGLLPALRYRRLDPANALREGGRGAGAGRERHRTRNALVVAQMAMALVLLVASGLLIRSFQNLQRVHPGFVEPERLVAFRISIPDAEIPDLERVALTHERIALRLGEVPGVESVGVTTSVTMGRGGGWDPIWTEDFPVPEGQLPPIRRFKWVGAGYFETMGNPVIAGRAFTWQDVRERAPYAIVTETLAREYWGEPRRAIGRRIWTGNATDNLREIIGVVGNERDDGLARDPVAIVYWPLAVENLYGTAEEFPGGTLFVPRSMEFVARSDRVGSADFAAAIREAVRSVHAGLPLANLRSLEADLRASMARTTFTLVMLAIAAAMALLLGAVGVYGVVSYVVSQRTREFGVRMVLGAEGGVVKRMVLGQGLRLTAVGIGVGLAAGVAVTRLMDGVLFGVGPLDPPTYGAVALLLTAVALLACYLPARRAARADPMEAIRAE